MSCFYSFFRWFRAVLSLGPFILYYTIFLGTLPNVYELCVFLSGS